MTVFTRRCIHIGVALNHKKKLKVSRLHQILKRDTRDFQLASNSSQRGRELARPAAKTSKDDAESASSKHKSFFLLDQIGKQNLPQNILKVMLQSSLRLPATPPQNSVHIFCAVEQPRGATPTKCFRGQTPWTFRGGYSQMLEKTIPSGAKERGTATE